MSTPTYNHYDLGQLVRITGTFTDSGGTVTDPATVIFAYKAPGDTAATEYTYGVDAEVVNSGTGVYYVDLDLDEVGTWYYRFYSTGTGQAAEESRLIVQESNFD